MIFSQTKHSVYCTLLYLIKLTTEIAVKKHIAALMHQPVDRVDIFWMISGNALDAGQNLHPGSLSCAPIHIIHKTSEQAAMQGG